MSDAQISPLVVYNASAGSGKTYHLVREYIRLLISREKDTEAFGRIIAMTFTNKAAIEMKERILLALDQLATDDSSIQTLAEDLGKTLGIAPHEVRARCQTVLRNLLHRYEEFHVLTIDKFNLRLIKSFSRDLDLPEDFEVILDEQELIEQVVDDIFLQLGERKDADLDRLIFQYARKKLDDGNSWNFRNDLIRFGTLLSKEQNNALVEQLLTSDFSVEQYRELQAKKAAMDRAFVKMIEPLRHQVEELDKAFLPGGGHTINDLGSICKHEQFPVQASVVNQRLSGNLDKEQGEKSIPENIRSMVREIEAFHAEQLEEYTALDLFLKHFFNMALLQYMAFALKTLRKQDQVIRISEFNSLISELIQTEKAPFIYERLGNRFRHFLLDEFQDTSRLQWLNLVPLVHNSIASNDENLIVGDPKQSIYRFKNGVAEQFVALPGIFNPESDPNTERISQYFQILGKVVPLENNWRSSPVIVDVNNRLFESMKTILPERSSAFYQSVKQTAMSTRGGWVDIHSREGKSTVEDQIYTLDSWIQTCLQDGYQAGDICILGGTNKLCNAWALGLTELGHRVVSSDSLLIHSDLHVRLVIAYFNRRLKPGGETEKKQFAELYFRLKSPDFETYKGYIIEKKNDAGKTFRVFDDSRFLRDFFNGSESFFFGYENLYDLIQTFYGMINVDELASPYLHHLADIVFEYSMMRGPDLRGFLEFYNSKKHVLALQVPESSDSVRVMTIHKSKGLEFPVVMIPGLDFGLDIKGEMLLETGDNIVYTRPTKNEILPKLADAYEEERNQILTDQVNLCYVALTRAEERLFVQNHFDPKKFGAVFHQALESLEDTVADEDGIHVSVRSDESRKLKHDEVESDLFHPTSLKDRLWFPHISFQDDPAQLENDYLNEERQFGVQFHLLMSAIQDVDDIDDQIEAFIRSGQVDAGNASKLRLRIREILAFPAYLELLDGAREILREASIIASSSEVIRPDQIVVHNDRTLVLDFKTGLPSEKDVLQVKQYSKVLQAIGYPNTEGYVFYTSTMTLQRVS